VSVRRLGIAGVVAVVGACGTLQAVDATDGPGGSDGGAGDASSDAVPADGAPTDADAGTTPYDAACDGARFCSDFDPPLDVVPFGWETSSGPSTSFALTTSDITPPYALALSAKVADDPIYLGLAPNGRPPTNWSWSMKVVATAGAGGADDLHVFELDCSGGQTIKVKVNSATAGVKLESNEMDQADYLGLVEGTWQTLSVVADGTHASLALDNVAVGFPIPAACAPPLVVRFGFVELGGTDVGLLWKVDFDRVRGDWN
jgi:hypothetical protein